MKYKYIFIVLVYRNTDDVVDLINSIQEQVKDFKIIIINSFFDQDSKRKLQDIAKNYACDFLNVENKGYGYGNNKGIDYAKSNYDFDFLIVSNPDIEIVKFNDTHLHECDEALIGPMITTAKNKEQNPYWVIENRIFEYIIYLGYKKKLRSLLFIGVAVNKIIRELFLFCCKFSGKSYAKVFALHGSFVIFPRKMIEKATLPIYDERIFLFSEEADLAHQLKRQGIGSFLTKDIAVKHKEDGSMKLAKIDEKDELRRSVMYYYSKHHRGGVR